MLRLPRVATAEVEAIVSSVIDAAVTVHEELGPGLLESIYARALCIELDERKIPFETEKIVPVTYKRHQLSVQRLDLMVAGSVIVEVKAVRRLDAVHQAQLLCYLKVTRCRIGLLVNFNVPLLKQGLRRMVF